MPEPATVIAATKFALDIGKTIFGFKKKRKAQKLQRQANAIRSKSSLLRNAILRTNAAKSYRAALAEGKVGSQQAGGTLRGSATQGGIAGTTSAFAGSLADTTRIERMGIRANQFDARGANQLFQASQVSDILGAAKIGVGEFGDWWQNRDPKSTTYAPPGDK